MGGFEPPTQCARVRARNESVDRRTHSRRDAPRLGGRLKGGHGDLWDSKKALPSALVFCYFANSNTNEADDRFDLFLISLISERRNPIKPMIL